MRRQRQVQTRKEIRNLFSTLNRPTRSLIMLPPSQGREKASVMDSFPRFLRFSRLSMKSPNEFSSWSNMRQWGSDITKTSRSRFEHDLYLCAMYRVHRTKIANVFTNEMLYSYNYNYSLKKDHPLLVGSSIAGSENFFTREESRFLPSSLVGLRFTRVRMINHRAKQHPRNSFHTGIRETIRAIIDTTNTL